MTSAELKAIIKVTKAKVWVKLRRRK